MFFKDATMVPSYFLVHIFYCLKNIGMRGYIVDCEACDQVVMQYDICEDIMACIQSWAVLREKYWPVSVKKFCSALTFFFLNFYFELNDYQQTTTNLIRLCLYFMTWVRIRVRHPNARSKHCNKIIKIII